MAEARSDREQQTQTSRETSSSQQQLSTRGQRGAVRRRGAFDYPTSPFDMMRRLTEQMFGPLAPIAFGNVASATDVDVWTPRIDVFERDGKLVVRADLPGMSPDDVRVEVRDNSLIISGERQQERREDREGYFLEERVYGSFYRVIPLPEGVDADNARARFRDGVLELEMDLPKGQQERGRQIAIEQSSESGQSNRSGQSSSAQSGQTGQTGQTGQSKQSAQSGQSTQSKESRS